ncbi:MAG: 2-oxoglutarate ferredoxin oxidoreductase subunit alpha [Myxococcales bacterium]|nr:2-oxoglutarate ferredoxin oxidoreductase subunit alpha [Myxococcales bacterium]
MTIQKTSIDSAVVRFAGDSGDGMQLTGGQFSSTSAWFGNDLATLPDYPAEIRAPKGTLFGVSGFQLQFAAQDIRTPGDQPDALVVMNPAALKVNLDDLRPGGVLVCDEDAFNKRNLQKAGYEANPLDDPSLKERYRVYSIALTKMAVNIGKETGLGNRDAERAKNMVALGLMYWLYDRPMSLTEQWLKSKFGRKPEILETNLRALRQGYAFGETAELFAERYEVVKQSDTQAGIYRNITGNQATALGMVAAGELSNRSVFLGSYPITPASDILHEMSRHKDFGVVTFQAEDEIAGICSAIGAAWAGGCAWTTTSGPGIALKSEAMGLALAAEIPMVIINVQRGGPSTGLPTKTEQSDLLQCLYGRNGDSPMPIVAAASPGDCFYAAIEATRIAQRYVTPVILLTDGYLANGAEPFLIPDVDSLPTIHSPGYDGTAEDYEPYRRNDDLARPWIAAGTPDLHHRIGGLERAENTGHISYMPDNHQRMTELRAAKVEKIAEDLPPLEIVGAESGDLLVIGWGGTWGAITTAVKTLHGSGKSVGSVHLRHLNPLPADLGEIIGRYKKVVVPELNNGQLIRLVREKYLVDAKGINKIQGKPFFETELVEKLSAHLED